ncbi:MAG: class I SAM-dependent methyltransferase [Rhizobium sp.]|nr:class I SAM-dependent methyltransferase [Rhizobium sp.]
MSVFTKTPIAGALLAQVVAMPLVAIATALLSQSVERTALIVAAVLLQGLLAAAICRLLGLAVWWLVIAFVFPLALVGALLAGNLPAWPFGLAFLVMSLVFSNTARGRVPLYLTNGPTADALSDLMTEKGVTRFLDLGCGLGGVVRAVAKGNASRRARGVENAPAVFLAARLLSRLSGAGQIRRQDLFSTDVSEEDVVYAFLSPEPMAALWAKLSAEMKPGSLFVSNSFAVPDRDPDETWTLTDRRGTVLYLYAMGREPSEKA